ncbi:MAG: hypothetical protein IBX40_00490 [Methanosarcinales archaeon]|nr:hypothetical protein [Methanosarcinales archaeon]
MSKKKQPAKKGFLERARAAASQQQATAERGKTKKQKQEVVVSEPVPVVDKTPEEKKKNYINGIIKTIVPALIGTLAGLFCFYQLKDGTEFPWISIMLLVIISSYYAQRIIYPLIKIDVKEFGTKDWLYVEFITVDFWLVVWTLLLN